MFRKEGICKTWTGLNAGTLANSADPDQMPQNVASDQGPHCLLKLQEVKGLTETVLSPYSGPFSQPTHRDNSSIGWHYGDTLLRCPHSATLYY